MRIKIHEKGFLSLCATPPQILIFASVVQWLWHSAANPKAAGSTPVAAVAFWWRRNARDPCTARCPCTLGKIRWSKFPEPSTASCRVIISWFRHVKSQILLLSAASQRTLSALAKAAFLELPTAQCPWRDFTHFTWHTFVNADNLSVVRNGVAILHVGRRMPAPLLKRSYCFVESANRNGRLDFFERVLAMVSTVKATDAGPGYLMADADATKRCCCCCFRSFLPTAWTTSKNTLAWKLALVILPCQ